MELNRRSFIKSIIGTMVATAVPGVVAVDIGSIGNSTGDKKWHCMYSLEYNLPSENSLAEDISFKTEQEAVKFANALTVNSLRNRCVSPINDYRFNVWVYYIDETESGNDKFYTVKSEANAQYIGS